MPNIAAALKLNKLPVIGLVPESGISAPSSPAVGQLWIDTNFTPKLFKVWDGSVWAVNNLYVGTTAGTVAAGDDSRITGAEQTANKNAAGGYAGLTAGKLAYSQLPVAADGVATASTTIQATDSRLSNQRVPTDASVTGGPAGANVKIAASTITFDNLAAALFDQAAGTSSLRKLSITTATSAIPGGTTLAQISTSNPAAASIDANSQKIINLAAPTNPNDAARLLDIQNSAAGIDSKPSVRAIATANVASLSGTTTIDGVSLIAGDRVLLAGQTTASANGPYVVAAGAWARATDSLNPNSVWFIEEGTTQHDTAWWITNDGAIVVGTTNLVISQFSGGVAYTPGTGITMTGGVISISASYTGQASITTVGTIATGVWNGTDIAVLDGGTGSSSAAGARTNLGVPQAGYAATLGAITAGTPLTVTHNLGTQDVIAQLRDASTNEYVWADIINASTTTVTVTTGINFSASALRIVVLPVA